MHGSRGAKLLIHGMRQVSQSILLGVNSVSVNYAIRFSGPVTALRWGVRTFSQKLFEISQPDSEHF
jgi:hypothetical protein